MANRAYSFRAKTVDAHTIKALSEVLQNILTDVCFTFDKDCIKLLTVDNKRPPQLLVHLRLSAENFDEYQCPKPLCVGVNLQHKYKMLKSIKKKDSIELFITKNDPGMLYITKIQPNSGQPSTSQIKIQKLSQVATDIPDAYTHPIHIDTSGFQRMCKEIQSLSASVRVYSKGSYLEFSCKSEGLYAHKVPFGELDEESTEDEYEDFFNTKSFSQLIKVSGLNSRMQVYIPGDKEIPIKLNINTGQLGKLEIYIKSINQLEPLD